MAIVIKATPAAYSSIHDDLIYTVYEATKVIDSVTYPNYKYIADVYINGTLQARIKKIQDPLTGIGIFNIWQVVRNYVATVFNPAPNLLVAQQLGAGVFNLSIQVKFGEEYAYTSYYALTVDTARVFFNNYNGRLVGATSSLVSFPNKVASYRPLTGQTLLTSTHNFIPYFPIVTTPVAVVVTPFGGGSVYSTTITPSNAYDLQLINIAPVALNALQAGTINASTKYYTVAVGGQTYTFNVICESQYTTYMIHFLNKLGGFESKLFTKVSRRSIDISKKDFGKVPYTVDSDGVVTYKNANGVYNETRSVYSSQFVEKLTLNSDLLTDAEYVWLEDLIVSPMVYLQDGNYFFPVIIKETNYEPKKAANDDLTNLTINLEYGTQNFAQAR